jgi:hypothetical protein
MAAVHGKIFGMKPGRNSFQFSVFRFQPGNGKFILAFAVLFLALAAGNRAQQIPNGHATDFTSNSYFEPPNEQKVKMKLTGAEASPLPGGLLDVKRLQIESFSVEGKLEMVVRAPQCTYAVMAGVASSAGHIEMQTGDGKFHIEGDGFLWRQNDSLLIISNRVHSVIQGGALKLSAP